MTLLLRNIFNASSLNALSKKAAANVANCAYAALYSAAKFNSARPFIIKNSTWFLKTQLVAVFLHESLLIFSFGDFQSTTNRFAERREK